MRELKFYRLQKHHTAVSVLVMIVLCFAYKLWAQGISRQVETVPAETLNRLDTTPPRGRPELLLDRIAWNYDCMECHNSIEAKWTRDHELSEHFHIKLQHGNNRFCLNCHHPKNRNAFVDYDGSEIAANNTVALCAKCHGTHHQDWKAGAHGRKNGFWDTSKGEQTRLSCSQCHDPHSPTFKAIKPERPPTYPVRAASTLSQDPKPPSHH